MARGTTTSFESVGEAVGEAGGDPVAAAACSRVGKLGSRGNGIVGLVLSREGIYRKKAARQGGGEARGEGVGCLR